MLKPAGAKTVEEYIEQIEEPRKSDIRALHAMILGAVPKLAATVQSGMIGYGACHYKYASGREGDSTIIGLASQKDYIPVYISAAENGEYVAEKHKSELPKASIGKVCIRFKRLTDIDLQVLEKLVKLGAKIMAKSAQA